MTICSIIFGNFCSFSQRWSDHELILENQHQDMNCKNTLLNIINWLVFLLLISHRAVEHSAGGSGVYSGPTPIELLPVDAEASDEESNLNELANRYLLQKGGLPKGTKKDAASVNAKLVVTQVQSETSGHPIVARPAAVSTGTLPVTAPAPAVSLEASAAAVTDDDGWNVVESKKPHHKKRGGRRSFGAHHSQGLLNKNWRTGSTKDTEAAIEGVADEESASAE